MPNSTQGAPNQMQSAQSYLEDRKAAVLASLRRQVPDLINEYLKIDAALAAMNTTAGSIAESVGDEYYGFRKPIDAIEAFLDNHGRPATRKDIASALANGGFARGRTPRPYWNVMAAIDYHLDKHSKKRIVEINDLVGKADWNKAMFKDSDK